MVTVTGGYGRLREVTEGYGIAPRFYRFYRFQKF